MTTTTEELREPQTPIGRFGESASDAIFGVIGCAWQLALGIGFLFAVVYGAVVMVKIAWGLAP